MTMPGLRLKLKLKRKLPTADWLCRHGIFLSLRGERKGVPKEDSKHDPGWGGHEPGVEK